MEFDIREVEPLVSVLVITYNHAPVIRQCLDSILMQETDFPYEICIGEDESNDGTREICMEYAERHPDRIKLILRSQSEPGRDAYEAQGNYNYVETLRTCRGKYVADCDGDDAWLDPLKLQKQVDVLEADDSICLVHSDYAVSDVETGEVQSTHCHRDNGHEHIIPDDRSSLMHDVLTSKYKITTCTAVTRRTALFAVLKESGYLFREYANGDTPMWCELVGQGSFAYIDEPLSVYHVLGESATHSHDPEKRLCFYNRNEDLKLHLAEKHKLSLKSFKRQKIRLSNRLSMITGEDAEIDALYKSDPGSFSLAEGVLYRFGKIKLLRGLFRRLYKTQYGQQQNAKLHFESDSSARRMVTNGVFTVVRFSVYTLSGFFFIPYLVHMYGDGAYGLIALAGFLTQYVGLIQRCVGNSVARFLNIALNQDDHAQASEIFSTAMVANAAFILLQAPILGLAVWKLDVLFDFPAESATDFRVLVLCNIACFFISMITGVLSTPIQAANRLDITSTADIVRLTLRLIFLVAAIQGIGAKLWIFGVVDLSLAVVNSIFIGTMCFRLAPRLRFKWKSVTRRWIQPVLNMAGWSIVTAMGGYMIVKTDVWMINRFVSDRLAGVYAAMLVWPNFLRQVSKQLASILAPVYMIDFAKGDLDRVAMLSLSSAKLLSCFVGFCVGGLYVLAEPMLSLWLRTDAHEYVPLFRMMIVYLVYIIGEGVLWQIYTTLNKMHVTGVISLSAGLLNIAVSMALIYSGYGVMGVAIGTACAQLLASAIAIPIGVCKEFKIPLRRVAWNHLCATLFLGTSLIATTLALNVYKITPIGGVLCFIPLLVSGLFFASRAVLSAEEQQVVSHMYDRVKNKIKPA